MSKERVKKIKERMAWLTMEINHERYYPGLIVKGFREELQKLIDELQELQNDLED
jgi:hypothetical protein